MRARHRRNVANNLFLALTCAALAPFVLSQESAQWEDVEARGLELDKQKKAILQQLGSRLEPDTFDQVVQGEERLEEGHAYLENRVRKDADELDEQWRRKYHAAAENYRDIQYKLSTIRILADQIDNNLSLYRTELGSARSKRDGFFHSLAGLGKSYIVLVQRPLASEERVKSTEYLASLAEDCAKRSLVQVRTASVVISDFGLVPDDIYMRGATIIISSADVVSQGSPPIWTFFPGSDGTVSFVYIQAYQVFPQYEPPESLDKTPASAAACLDQAHELTSPDQYPELPFLQGEEIQGRITRLLDQRDSINEKVREKLENEYADFMQQMDEAKRRLQKSRESIRDHSKSLEIVTNDLMEQLASIPLDVQSLDTARQVYLDSQQLLGAEIDFGAPILNDEKWRDNYKRRQKARDHLVVTLSQLAEEAIARLSDAIRIRSLILWQRENIFVQGDPGDIARRTVNDMIGILKQRAERLRSYKVLKLRENGSDQALTSVLGTQFYQPGIPEKMMFPKIRLHFRANPGGTYSRSLEIFLAMRFLYEQQAESSPQSAEELTQHEPAVESQFSAFCRQHLDRAASQQGRVRRSDDFLFLFDDDRIVQIWYLGGTDRPIPRSRIENELTEIPCFTKWRLPKVHELRALVNLPGSVELPEGLWTSEDDGLGTEWKVYFPADDNDVFRGGAYMWWFAAVTDTSPETHQPRRYLEDQI